MKDKLEELKDKIMPLLTKIGFKMKEKPTMMTTMATSYEINLVPEVKEQMLKAMRTRNLVLFICLIVVAASGSVVAVLASVAGGQNVAIDNQEKKLVAMSEKINSYESLSELLTIQAQLTGADGVNSEKNVLSRVFSFVNAILPSAPDELSISEMNVNLEANTLSFEAQADAKVAPLIDYRVLESFKKGLAFTKYDYGRYVDESGNVIPTYCIVETTEDGEILNDGTNVYAYWLRGMKGCDAERNDEEEEEEEEDSPLSNMSYDVNELLNGLSNTTARKEKEEKIDEDYDKYYEELNDYEKTLADRQLESGDALKQNIKVEKIWRTPRFTKWYNDGNMDLGGTITGVPHFESECTRYEGTEIDENAENKIRWTTQNECMFAKEEMKVRDSSNGRDASGDLVLRFSAVITVDDQVFKFGNKHMLAIGPSGRNVTDSYRQIEGMFAERAADCSDADVVCTTNKSNITGDGNSAGEDGDEEEEDV